MKVTELCGSECLLKTTKVLKEVLSCFVEVVHRQARIIVAGEGVQVLVEDNIVFWLIAKVTYSCGLIFEGGVLCVKN